MPRRVRISHWEVRKRIRWTDVDPTWPTYLFPHSEEFRLFSLSTRCDPPDSDEVKGSLNLPIPLLGPLADLLLSDSSSRRWCGIGLVFSAADSTDRVRTDQARWVG